MKFSLWLELSKICTVTMSTALVWFPIPPKKKKAFLGNFVPRGVNHAKLGGWVGGGGGWRAVTAEGCWLSPVRRQMAVDWPALWQFSAQKARAKCTLGMGQVWGL